MILYIVANWHHSRGPSASPFSCLINLAFFAHSKGGHTMGKISLENFVRKVAGKTTTLHGPDSQREAEAMMYRVLNEEAKRIVARLDKEAIASEDKSL